MNDFVISGIGIVCARGCNRLEVLEHHDEDPILGTSEGIHHSDLPLVAKVPPHFSLKGIVKKRKHIKLMARANQFAVAATDEAIKHAALTEEDCQDAGLFFGVGREPSDIDALLPSVGKSLSEGQLTTEKLFQEGINWINPLSSLKTLPNMSLAHASIHAGSMGPNMTLYGEASFRQAIEAAQFSLQKERCSIALVGVADSCVSFFDRLSAAREARGELVSEGAVVWIIEKRDDAIKRGIRPIASLSTIPLHQADYTNKFGASGAATLGLNATCHLIRSTANPAVEVMSAERLSALSSSATVITGIGLVTPIGQDFETFEHRLFAGHSAVAPITHFDATPFSVRNACEVSGEDYWGAIPEHHHEHLRRLNERSVSQAMGAAYKALIDAKSPSHIGQIVYGTGLSSVSIRELRQDCIPYLAPQTLEMKYGDVRVYGTSPHEFVSPLRHDMSHPLDLLNRDLQIHTPHITHFSACAAGAGAIGHAHDLIRSGQHRQILVGASDSMIHPYGLIPFERLGATSTTLDPNNASKPFDQARNGFVMGEAAVFFVLESLESARERGVKPYAHILGWGSSCDAHNVTAPHPKGDGAYLSMQRAIEDADCTPEDIDYINAHGTGTPLNDQTEARAIHRLFEAHQPWVSSSKAHFGHCIGTAGTIEMVACIAALRMQQVPPNLNLDTPEPNLGIRLAPQTSLTHSLRTVMSNSFGFGGQNVSLVLGVIED